MQGKALAIHPAGPEIIQALGARRQVSRYFIRVLVRSVGHKGGVRAGLTSPGNTLGDILLVGLEIYRAGQCGSGKEQRSQKKQQKNLLHIFPSFFGLGSSRNPLPVKILLILLNEDKKQLLINNKAVQLSQWLSRIYSGLRREKDLLRYGLEAELFI
jgi:hypothetical protein